MNQPADVGERWRLFIAIAASEAVRVEIEKTQVEMRRALREARITWTRREQFHLTLRRGWLQPMIPVLLDLGASMNLQ